MKIDDYLIPSNFEKGRRGLQPLGIVIHTMVGTLEGTYQWFKNPQSQVSSHYGIGLDGRVWRFVKEEDTAWHAGNVYGATAKLIKDNAGTNPNLFTIGIEHEDKGQPEAERTEAEYESSAQLVYEICKRWNIPIDREHIINHREIYSRKTCPGALDIDRIVNKAKTMGTNNSQPTLDWAIKLESFFMERSIPPERRESEVRKWSDDSKILQGFVTKWVQTLNLPADSGLSQIESQFDELMKTEDRFVFLRNAVEIVVGHLESDSALAEALAALQTQKKKMVEELAQLKTKVEEWNKKKNEDLVRVLKKWGWIVKIYRELNG